MRIAKYCAVARGRATEGAEAAVRGEGMRAAWLGPNRRTERPFQPLMIEMPERCAGLLSPPSEAHRAGERR